MNKNWKRLVPLLLSVVMVLGLGQNVFAVDPETTHPCRYDYVLLPVQDGVSDGIVRLELYIQAQWSDSTTPGTPDPLLDAGAFGLRFPEWLTGYVTFQATEFVTIQRIVPEQRYTYGSNEMELKGNGYHAFNWFGRMEPGPQGTIIKGKGWETNLKVGGYAMKIGEYTMDLKAASAPETEWQLPYQTDVGQLDWLSIKEAIAAEVWDTAANGQDALNRTIWNPETKLYQGYYADPSADPNLGAPPVQVDIGFRFKAPEPWPSANAVLILQSYDPKKAVTVELYRWDTDENGYEPTAAYVLECSGAASGTGPCRQEIGFADANFTYVPANSTVQGAKLPDGKYRMVISKQSHVRAIFEGVTVRWNDGELELFPQLDGRTLTLPCGDVTSDGKIRQADRMLLMQPGRYCTANTEAGLYDLNGDLRVDQRDLSILTAPANYGKNDFSIGFTETTNVGDNGI